MNDAKEYIKSKHNGEIPYKYGANECARLMEAYAKHYHEREVKKLRLGDVVGRSEQLKDFVEEFIEAWEDGNGGDSDLYRKAKSL